MEGPFQRRNAAVAHGVIMALPAPYRLDRQAIERGFAMARIPGRFDRRGKWLFDVAHNPDGMRALTAALRETAIPRPIHALVSILGDKAWPDMLVRLDAAVDRGVLTVAPTAAGRGWDMAWLDRWLRDPTRPPAKAQWSLEPDFQKALSRVQQGAATVLVTGSFHTVGDVMAAVGMEP
jgi:dihydrofolate synthase/folylpolyglutamate synthase